VEPMKFTALFKELTFPLTLATDELPLYMKLLRERCEQAESAPRPNVPNDQRMLRSPDGLYSREESMFLRILQKYQPETLVHEDVNSVLCSLLTKFGLHNKLDFDSFRFCVGILDRQAQKKDVSFVRQAAEAYNCYREQLIWIREVSERWGQLDQLQFIPRDENRCPYELPEEALSLIKELPIVVRPSEIVLDVHERIAWSQRARLQPNRQPGDRLRASHKTLGVPSVEDAVSPLSRAFLIMLYVTEAAFRTGPTSSSIAGHCWNPLGAQPPTATRSKGYLRLSIGQLCNSRKAALRLQRRRSLPQCR